MPSRLPSTIPRLVLYTGGPECSLCEVAKAELSKLQKRVRFDVDYWNIRDPPAGSDEREAKKWRRLYQYDIVSDLSVGSPLHDPCGDHIVFRSPRRVKLMIACPSSRRSASAKASHRCPGSATNLAEVAHGE